VAERLAEARLLAAWPEVAGPAGARSRAESIEDGVLHVAVASAGWLHRLTLGEPTLLAPCRAIAPAVTVRAFRFRLGSLPGPHGEGGSVAPVAAADAERQSESQDPSTIDAVVAPVRNRPDLANALERALRATGTERAGGEVSP